MRELELRQPVLQAVPGLLGVAIARAALVAVAVVAVACDRAGDDERGAAPPRVIDPTGDAAPAAPPAAARPGPDGLAAELDLALRAIAISPRPAETAAVLVRGWKLPAARWEALVVDAYRPHARDYAIAFDAAAPALAARLVTLAAPTAAVRARVEYGDDRALSPAQARTRWVTPTGRAGVVATVGDAPLDVVFLWDGLAWRALLGVDDVVVQAVAAREPSCRAAIAAAGPPGVCSDVGWMIADAAMRDQRDRLHHGCVIAAAQQCGAAP